MSLDILYWTPLRRSNLKHLRYEVFGRLCEFLAELVFSRLYSLFHLLFWTLTLLVRSLLTFWKHHEEQDAQAPDVCCCSRLFGSMYFGRNEIIGADKRPRFQDLVIKYIVAKIWMTLLYRLIILRKQIVLKTFKLILVNELRSSEVNDNRFVLGV